jgi:hypothetical protein
VRGYNCDSHAIAREEYAKWKGSTRSPWSNEFLKDLPLAKAARRLRQLVEGD